MKERTIALLWLLGVFGFLVLSAYLVLPEYVTVSITGLAGAAAGYYFARDANGQGSSSP